MGVLLVRTEAGPAVGMGHVMRCLALAQAWTARGGTARFLLSDGASTPSLRRTLAADGVAVESLSEAPGSPGDAAATAEIAGRLDVEALVIDGYAFGPAFRESVRNGCGAPILVVDDLGGDEPWPADVILNQNLHAREALYADRPPGSELLLGPRYALLRSEIRAIRRAEGSPADPVRTLLVAFGGADPVDATSRFLPALAGVPDIRARVLVGPANPRLESLRRLSAELPGGIEVLAAGEDYPRVLADADLAVTAAGSTCWELCYLGIPFVTIVLADNQAPIAASLQEAGASIDLGKHTGLAAGDLAVALGGLLANHEKRLAMSQAGRRLVDGLGAERVAGRIAAARRAA
jgi:UDP-2,4-diacetamido-2,4,6-trideoxy-beta-L-altropyranose hydrolase